MSSNEHYNCKTCKKSYPTFFFNENTELLPICNCGDDLYLVAKSNLASMASWAADQERKRLEDESEERMENMMLHGVDK